MPKLKPATITPTLDEVVAINAGIAADSDACELDYAWFESAKPINDVFTPEVYAELVAIPRPR